MEGYDYLRIVFVQTIYHLPIFIVLIIGLAVSLIRYRKYPKVSLISAIACITLFLLNIVSIFMPLLTMYLYRQVQNPNSVTYLTYFLNFVVSLFNAIALGLLIFAVWRERPKTKTTEKST